MKKIGAVALAEIADKLLLFPGALLIGFFPLALALLRPRPTDARDAAAVFLALLTGATLAVFLGARSTAGDLASGRSRFYLAKPLTSFQLWFGKLAGSLLLVYGAAALTLLPGALAGAGSRDGLPGIRALGAILPFRADPVGTALAAAAGLGTLFLLSQAAGVAALARSPLLAVDGALAAAALFAGAKTAARLRSAGAVVALEAALLVLGILLSAAAAMGCYRAVKEGVDARRSSAGQSRVFWSVAATGVVLFALFGVWVLRARPADLTAVWWTVPAPRGDWIAESGPARWHRPVFLENVRTGEFLRVGSLPVISPDGSAAAWSERRPGVPEPSFIPRSVSLSDPRHPETAWETKDLHEEPLLVFSPDARRLAIIASDRVVVWDAARGGMLAAAKPPSPLWTAARGFTGATFAGEDVLKIYEARQSAGNFGFIDLYSFDVRNRTFRRTGTAGPFTGTFPILADAARARILVREKGATIDLLDGETGATRKTFRGEGVAFRSASFLTGGGIALFESAGGAGRVIVLSAGGEEERRIPVGPADRAWLLGEWRPGTIALAAGTAGEVQRHRCRVLLVDLASGAVRTSAKGVMPVAVYASALSGDPGWTAGPGSLATRLFVTPEDALVELEGPGRLRRLHPAR